MQDVRHGIEGRVKVKRPKWQERYGQESLFPSHGEEISREERLRRIKSIVRNEDYVTDEKLEHAIERLINSVIFS